MKCISLAFFCLWTGIMTAQKFEINGVVKDPANVDLENRNGNSGIVSYKMKDRLPNGDFQYINTELYFNENKSLFIFDKIGMDSLQQGNSLKTHKKGENTKVSMSFSSSDNKGFLVYRDFRAKQLILRFTDAFPFDPYIVREEWAPFKWTIMDEHKKILGFKAQKAIAQFRGRIYIVWFTLEIPVSYGPWKFFGLPGLIVEVYDTTKTIEFKLTEACYPCDGETEIITKPFEKKERTLQEHVYIHDYYNEMVLLKFNKAYRKIGKEGGFSYGNGRPTTLKDIKESRNNKIEIIYEWEDFPGDTESPYDQTLTEKAFESIPQKVRAIEERKIENQSQVPSIELQKEIKK